MLLLGHPKSLSPLQVNPIIRHSRASYTDFARESCTFGLDQSPLIIGLATRPDAPAADTINLTESCSNSRRLAQCAANVHYAVFYSIEEGKKGRRRSALGIGHTCPFNASSGNYGGCIPRQGPVKYQYYCLFLLRHCRLWHRRRLGRRKVYRALTRQEGKGKLLFVKGNFCIMADADIGHLAMERSNLSRPDPSLQKPV